MVHGTAGIANIAVAVVGTCVYALRGTALEYEVGVPLMIGVVIGAWSAALGLGGGTVAHVRQGTAWIPVGARLACGAGVGAVVGALLAVEIPGTGLGLFFGLFMLAMAARSAGC